MNVSLCNSVHSRAGIACQQAPAYQVPDPQTPKLFHVYITFSLEICDQLAGGIIIPGLGVRGNNLDAACSSSIVSPSEKEDDDYFEEEDDDSFEDPDDSMDSPAAGSSTSPSALYATPTSFAKRPMSPAKEASPLRL